MMGRFQKKSLSLLLLTLFGSQTCGQTLPTFSADLLRSVISSDQEIDISHFEQGLTLLPGIYEVDVYLNRHLLKRGTFDFRVHNGTLIPVMSKSSLKKLGIDVTNVDGISSLKEDDEIFPITDYLTGAQVVLDGTSLKLDFTIPQIYLKHSISSQYDVVDSALWDSGITAAMLNYNLMASHNKSRQTANTHNEFANLWLDGQINLGDWRLLTSATLTYSSNKYNGIGSNDQEWDIWNTYLQRDVPIWRSTLKIGEISTTSDLFDSVSMRGVSLASNEQMIPIAERSFMPSLTGVANTFAQIFVRQNGRIVYQTTVAPGPWEINNIPALNSDADIEVVVRESDGTERVEIIPYSSVPLMLRSGQFRYDFNIGKYDQQQTDDPLLDPWFGQLSFAYGLPWNTTLLGGIMASQDYQAYAIGSAFSLGDFGALSFDAIHSNASIRHFNNRHSLSGWAYRVRYEKTIQATGTSVNFASYRYADKNYRSFGDLQRTNETKLFDSREMKQRLQVSLSQPLGQWGQLSASGNYVSYYDNRRANKTWAVSYSKNIKGVATRLSYSRSYVKNDGDWEPDDRFMLNFDISLGQFINERTNPLKHGSVAYQATFDDEDDGGNQHRVTYRHFNPDSDWYWQASQIFGNQSVRESSMMIGYDGDRLAASLSYSRTHDQHSYMLSTAGGLLLHSGGITASSRAYDSVALIQVPDVEGVKINQSANVYTDSNGFAVVPNLRNYSANELSIDPSTLPDGAILINGTNQMVYPTSRSIVRLTYPVRVGKEALFYLYKEDGQPLPFATPVVLEEKDGSPNRLTSYVGHDGRTYFSGVPSEGCLIAKWKTEQDDYRKQFCYRLPEQTSDRSDSFVNIPHVHLKAKSID